MQPEVVARRQRNAVPLGSLPAMPRARGERMPPMICRAIFEELFILASGDIVCASPDPHGRRIYGNVKHDRISDVVNGQMYQEMRNWQLDSQPDSWCPVTAADCARRTARPSRVDRPDRCRITNVEIEPVSACNVKCPECPVTLDFKYPELHDRAKKILPLATMNSIVDQLVDLQKIRLYGFGEPLLHKDLIEFLKTTKRARPDIHVGVSTNGIPLNDVKIEAITKNALVDRMVFAIDGVAQNSYQRYRVGGNVEVALGNMAKMARMATALDRRKSVDIVWQYILFEWNDSDEEIGQAKHLADQLGVTIDWLPTHSAGRSRRYLANSAELERLQGRAPSTGSGTAEVKLGNLLSTAGVPSDKYLAEIESTAGSLIVGVSGTIGADVRITNLSRSDWVWNGWDATAGEGWVEPFRGVRIGALVQDLAGRSLGEIWSGVLPDGKLNAGCSVATRVLSANPFPPGDYRLLIDMVDEGRCWFHERGSAPLICEMRVVAAGSPMPAKIDGERHHERRSLDKIDRARAGKLDASDVNAGGSNLGELFDRLPANASVELDYEHRPPAIVIRLPLE